MSQCSRMVQSNVTTTNEETNQLKMIENDTTIVRNMFKNEITIFDGLARFQYHIEAIEQKNVKKNMVESV